MGPWSNRTDEANAIERGLQFAAPFTGTVKKALVDATGVRVEDMEAKMRIYLARQ